MPSPTPESQRRTVAAQETGGGRPDRACGGGVMARRRVELRRIENRTSRLSRFSKRRAGLLKKARELAVLCDVEVGVLIFSPLGKHSHFASRGSMEKTINRYQKNFETEINAKRRTCGQKGQSRLFPCRRVSSELLNVARRLSDGQSTGTLNANDLDRLQEQLDAALRNVRDRMMELMMKPINMLKEKEKVLLQERMELQLVLGMDAAKEDGEHRESRKCVEDTFGKNKEEGIVEHCVDDGAGMAETSLRLWWPRFQPLG